MIRIAVDHKTSNSSSKAELLISKAVAFPMHHGFKRLVSRPKASDKGGSSVSLGDERSSAPQYAAQGPSNAPRWFRDLVERSITAWNALSYAGDPKLKDLHFQVLSETLRGFESIDDLLRSEIVFCFFQRREFFFWQDRFLKWNPIHLEHNYVLLPVGYGFINKRDCYYVSHFWRTKEHPDPQGEDFEIVAGHLAIESWEYVWVDWTCLPQSPRSNSQTEYATKMLQRTSILMRSCAFEWTYPLLVEPRLWILVEVAQHMLTGNGFATTSQIGLVSNDVLAMETEGVRQVIRRRGYQCSIPGDYRLLVGWLELLVIASKLVPDVFLKRSLLDSLDASIVSNWNDHATGIEVNKATGIVSYGKQVYRFAPLWPVGEDGLPEVVAEPSRCEPPACVDKIIGIVQHPELNAAKRQLTEKEQTLGMHHADTIASVRKLANVFIRLEHYREAEELRRRVVTSLQETLGPEHPYTLDAINKVGGILHVQKRYDESTVLFQRYLDGMKGYTGK